jgi:hypothetical protein
MVREGENGFGGIEYFLWGGIENCWEGRMVQEGKV